MLKAKQKSKRSKETTAKREYETSFMKDTSLKKGHGKLPRATAPRGGEGLMETFSSVEVSDPGEDNQVRKKPSALKRFKRYLTFSKAIFETLYAVPNQPNIPG